MASYFEGIRPADYISGGFGQIGSGLSSMGDSMEREQAYQRQQAELNAPAPNPEDIQAWINHLGPEKVKQIAEHSGDLAELGRRDSVQLVSPGMRGGMQGNIPVGERGADYEPQRQGGWLPDTMNVGDSQTTQVAPQGITGGVDPNSRNYPEARQMLHGYLGEGASQPRTRTVPVPAQAQMQRPPAAPTAVEQPALQPRGDWSKIRAKDMPYVEKAMNLQGVREQVAGRDAVKDKDIAAKFGLKQYEQSQINERFGEKNIREWAKLDQADGNHRIDTAVKLEALRNRLEVALIGAEASKDKAASSDFTKLLAIVAGYAGKLGGSMNLQDMPEVQNMLQVANARLNAGLQAHQNELGGAPQQPAATGPVKAIPPQGGTVKMKFPNGTVRDVPRSDVQRAKTQYKAVESNG